MRFIPFLLVGMLLTLSISSYGQSKEVTIKGTIIFKDSKDAAVGVSILSGSPPKPVAVSDADGKFDISVEKNAILTFRYVGFEEKHLKVTKDELGLKITLAPSSEALKEAVVVGFKKQSRETSTGAVTTISGKELHDVPVANVTDLLQGKVPGLNIQINNGAPGVMGTIQLRGLSTTQVNSSGFLTPTSPLFVVDGVPIDPNEGYSYGFDQAGPGLSPLSLIPPEDIAEVQVLKDAAATSVYGSRGAYGVIIITTKRGKSKVPIVRYSGSFFLNTPPKLRKVIGGKEERNRRIWQIMHYDSTEEAGMALINETPYLADSLNPYYRNSTNWQALFFRPTYNQTHNIDISGGDDHFNYKGSLNYYNENGIIKNTGFSRYALGMNALYQPNDRFRMTSNIQISYGKKNNGSGVGLLQTGVASGVNTSSLLPAPSFFSNNNSVLKNVSIRDDNNQSNIRANLNIQWEPIKGIRFGDVASYDLTSSTSNRFTPSFVNDGASLSYSYNSYNYTLYNRATITYTKTINERHLISAFLFDELTSSKLTANSLSLNQTSSDEIAGPLGYSWSKSIGGRLNNMMDKRIHGFGGSFTYNFDTKYIFNFSYRLDGTSTNGPAKGYTINPAISGRWNFGKERWMDNVSWVSYGAFRGSWGKNIVPTGDVFDVYGVYSPGEKFNDDHTIYIDDYSIPNPVFQPQTTTTTDIGFEGGFFHDRLEATFDAYYKSVDNQIINIDLPTNVGFKTKVTNGVSLVDYGYEWSLTYRIFKPSSDDKALQSTISFNGAINRDILTRLPEGIREMKVDIMDGDVNVPVLYRLGKNTLSNELYYTRGVYANNTQVPTDPFTGIPQTIQEGVTSVKAYGGVPQWADVNGDYKIDENDFVVIGDPEPKIVGGISSYTTWNNFTFRVNVSYTLMRDLLNLNMASLLQQFGDPATPSPLLPINQFDYWKSSGTDKYRGSKGAVYGNPYDFINYNNIDPFRTNQTVFMEDGSYWKINNITLAYNIPRAYTNRWHITSTRFFLTVNNVFTFSKYSGPDPENVTALGRDQSGGYPQRRSYSIGFDVQF